MAPPRKTVLITGCSEGGIGWHLCVAFAEQGCNVFATARRLEAMRGLEARGLTCLVLDVTDAASIQKAVNAVPGRIDILVNNAGMGNASPLVECPLSDVRALYEANVFGLLAVTQAVAPAMMNARSGTIVNIASVVGLVGTPFGGVYSSSKAAVVNLTDALRIELAPFGVKVMTVCPGAIRSNIGDNNLQRLDLTSYRLYAPFRDAIAARATASQSAASTPTDVFATRVVRDVLRPAPPPLLVWGHMAGVFKLMLWMPRWLRDMLLSRRFGLNVTLPPPAR